MKPHWVIMIILVVLLGVSTCQFTTFPLEEYPAYNARTYYDVTIDLAVIRVYSSQTSWSEDVIQNEPMSSLTISETYVIFARPDGTTRLVRNVAGVETITSLQWHQTQENANTQGQ